jgi:hypothetical protein
VEIGNVVAQLRRERSRIQKELGRLDEAISALQGLTADHSATAQASRPRVRRKLSAAARKRISEAQKARWAKIKKRTTAA